MIRASALALILAVGTSCAPKKRRAPSTGATPTQPTPAGQPLPVTTPAAEPPADAGSKDASPADAKAAVDPRLAMCAADNAEACFALGRASTTRPVEKRQYMEKGCKLSRGRSCTAFAIAALRLGERKQARSALERGCSAGAPLACTLLGEAYFHGEHGNLNLTTSKAKARSFHQRAWKLWREMCDAGDGASCDIVGLAYITGRTGHNAGSGMAVKKDVAKGQLVLDRACKQLGHKPACETRASK